MAPPRLVGIGASAGGIEALIDLVPGLRDGLPAAVLVVLHRSASSPSVLPGILARRTGLAVAAARNGDEIRPGHVYVALPDHDLQVVQGRVSTGHGPKENGHRPAIDPLFRSLALEAGPGATGVVLSGMLDDGAAGLLEIVRHGGTALVQDPSDALQRSMPDAALEQVPGALVRPAGELGPLLHEVVDRHLLGGHRSSDRLVAEVAVGRGEPFPPEALGEAAGLVCPDCSGPLFEMESPGHRRFRCRIGHAWSPGSLGAAQDEVVEQTLDAALRALENKAALQQRIAETAAASGAQRVAGRARNAAGTALRDAARMRELITGVHRGHDDRTDGGVPAHDTSEDDA